MNRITVVNTWVERGFVMTVTTIYYKKERKTIQNYQTKSYTRLNKEEKV